MSNWTIACEAVNDSFAALALSNLRFTFHSLAPDRCTFDAPGAAFDGTARFAYKALATISYGSTRWFHGRVNSIPRQGRPDDERIAYELVGPWWWLEKIDFQQPWQVWNGEEVDPEDDPVLVPGNRTRVILNQGEDGNRISIGSQIRAAVEFARDAGAPLAVGTIDAGPSLPFDERLNISCAEVITQLLRFMPTMACWFDHSTAPYPTFNCRLRSNLTAVSFALTAGQAGQSLDLTPRYDLVIPGWRLIYEQSSTINGVEYEKVVEDTAGDVDDPEAVNETIELSGSSMTVLSQKITTENWPADLNTASWWQARVPALSAAGISNVAITNAARSGSLPRILSEGAKQDWMDDITVEAETVTAVVTYTEVDDSLRLQTRTQKLSLSVQATDAETKTYRRVGSYAGGESIPTDLAASLLAAWAELQWSGSYSVIREEIAQDLMLGTVLNLTGGLTAWATMRAIIERVEMDVETGLQTAFLGVHTPLGPSEMLALRRANRLRRPSWRYQVRQTGLTNDAGSELPQSGQAPRSDAAGLTGRTTAVSGVTKRKVQQIIDDAGNLDFDWIRSHA